VLVSESDWRAISETIHLSAIPGMVDSIKKGMKENIEDCSETLEW
jgi:PHD/YefM family antitoxin component YafN of YafNO toxin-antitoxin module